MQAYLTPEALENIKEQQDADNRVWELLDIIVGEFETDPQSVQCFDLRIVHEAIELVKKRKTMNDTFNPFKRKTNDK